MHSKNLLLFNGSSFLRAGLQFLPPSHSFSFSLAHLPPTSPSLIHTHTLTNITSPLSSTDPFNISALILYSLISISLAFIHVAVFQKQCESLWRLNEDNREKTDSYLETQNNDIRIQMTPSTRLHKWLEEMFFHRVFSYYIMMQFSCVEPRMFGRNIFGSTLLCCVHIRRK